MINKLIYATLLSVLVFFAVSFATVLFQIQTPFYRPADGSFDIGFPLIYYKEFIVDNTLHYSWDVKNLLLDCALFWGATAALYLLIPRKRSTSV